MDPSIISWHFGFVITNCLYAFTLLLIILSIQQSVIEIVSTEFDCDDISFIILSILYFEMV